MEFLTKVYLFYTFVGLYYLILFSMIYFQNRRQFYEKIKPKKEYSLSIVIPCYNEEKTIGTTVENLLASSYKGLKRVIVVDDCSTDSSYKIVKALAKKDKRILLVQTPKNTGCAAGAKNYGSKFVDTELIGFTDSDSYPEREAIINMVGYFNDLKTGAVTSRVLVKNKGRFLARLQAIEYKVIAFTRKLLGFVDAIYVTNGPLSIYRKKAFDEVGGFDNKNLTEDIEITWHFVAKGYKVHMAIPAKVYTLVPEDFKSWLRQRRRWNVGGIQTIVKYKSHFLKSGMLGLFIIPFFVIAWILGIVGLSILSYRIFRIIIIRYLSTQYSIEAQTAILTLSEINLSPSIIFYFGIFLIAFSLLFNVLAINRSRASEGEDQSVRDLFFYMFVYLLVYPIVLIISMYKFIKKDFTWH